MASVFKMLGRCVHKKSNFIALYAIIFLINVTNTTTFNSRSLESHQDSRIPLERDINSGQSFASQAKSTEIASDSDSPSDPKTARSVRSIGQGTDAPYNLTSEDDLPSVSPAPLQPVCQAFINGYSDAVAEFSRCIIRHARPLKVCEFCIESYTRARTIYDVIMKEGLIDETGQHCQNLVFSLDRVEVVASMNTFVKQIWDTSNCNECFSTYKDSNGTTKYVLSNETIQFQKLSNATHGCIANYSQGNITPLMSNSTANLTVCEVCEPVYGELNRFYVHLEDESHHEVCMDIVDSMNMTRILWSQSLHCSKKQKDVVPILCLTGFFCTLPIVFYVASKINGVRREKKILKQKRLNRNSANTSDNENSHVEESNSH